MTETEKNKRLMLLMMKLVKDNDTESIELLDELIEDEALKYAMKIILRGNYEKVDDKFVPSNEQFTEPIILYKPSTLPKLMRGADGYIKPLPPLPPPPKPTKKNW